MSRLFVCRRRYPFGGICRNCLLLCRRIPHKARLGEWITKGNMRIKFAQTRMFSHVFDTHLRKNGACLLIIPFQYCYYSCTCIFTCILTSTLLGRDENVQNGVRLGNLTQISESHESSTFKVLPPGNESTIYAFPCGMSSCCTCNPVHVLWNI